MGLQRVEQGCVTTLSLSVNLEIMGEMAREDQKYSFGSQLYVGGTKDIEVGKITHSGKRCLC